MKKLLACLLALSLVLTAIPVSAVEPESETAALSAAEEMQSGAALDVEAAADASAQAADVIPDGQETPGEIVSVDPDGTEAGTNNAGAGTNDAETRMDDAEIVANIVDGGMDGAQGEAAVGTADDAQPEITVEEITVEGATVNAAAYADSAALPDGEPEDEATENSAAELTEEQKADPLESGLVTYVSDGLALSFQNGSDIPTAEGADRCADFAYAEDVTHAERGADENGESLTVWKSCGVPGDTATLSALALEAGEPCYVVFDYLLAAAEGEDSSALEIWKAQPCEAPVKAGTAGGQSDGTEADETIPGGVLADGDGAVAYGMETGGTGTDSATADGTAETPAKKIASARQQDISAVDDETEERWESAACYLGEELPAVLFAHTLAPKGKDTNALHAAYLSNIRVYRTADEAPASLRELLATAARGAAADEQNADGTAEKPVAGQTDEPTDGQTGEPVEEQTEALTEETTETFTEEQSEEFAEELAEEQTEELQDNAYGLLSAQPGNAVTKLSETAADGDSLPEGLVTAKPDGIKITFKNSPKTSPRGVCFGFACASDITHQDHKVWKSSGTQISGKSSIYSTMAFEADQPCYVVFDYLLAATEDKTSSALNFKYAASASASSGWSTNIPKALQKNITTVDDSAPWQTAVSYLDPDNGCAGIWFEHTLKASTKDKNTLHAAYISNIRFYKDLDEVPASCKATIKTGIQVKNGEAGADVGTAAFAIVLPNGKTTNAQSFKDGESVTVPLNSELSRAGSLEAGTLFERGYVLNFPAESGKEASGSETSADFPETVLTSSGDYTLKVYLERVSNRPGKLTVSYQQEKGGSYQTKELDLKELWRDTLDAVVDCEQPYVPGVSDWWQWNITYDASGSSVKASAVNGGTAVETPEEMGEGSINYTFTPYKNRQEVVLTFEEGEYAKRTLTLVFWKNVSWEHAFPDIAEKFDFGTFGSYAPLLFNVDKVDEQHPYVFTTPQSENTNSQYSVVFENREKIQGVLSFDYKIVPYDEDAQDAEAMSAAYTFKIMLVNRTIEELKPKDGVQDWAHMEILLAPGQYPSDQIKVLMSYTSPTRGSYAAISNLSLNTEPCQVKVKAEGKGGIKDSEGKSVFSGSEAEAELPNKYMGSLIELTAEPEQGYIFAGWYAEQTSGTDSALGAEQAAGSNGGIPDDADAGGSQALADDGSTGMTASQESAGDVAMVSVSSAGKTAEDDSVSNLTLIESSSTLRYKVEGDITFTARFIEATGDNAEALLIKGNGGAPEWVGDLDEALKESASAGKGTFVVVRKKDEDVKLDADAAVPAGVTLLVPCKDGDGGYDSKTGFNPDGTKAVTSDRKGVSPDAKQYCGLTVPEGVALTVNGTVLVNAVTGRPAQGHWDHDVTGGYGEIDLEGQIAVNSGGVLDVCGYVKGGGSITARPGGEVRDLYIVRNWRGGSQAYAMFPIVYPMNEVDMHNIEVPTVIEAGASLVGTVKMYASGSYYYTRFPQVDQGNGLIRQESGSVRKEWDGSSKREKYILSGSGVIRESTLNIVGMDLSTGGFLYPIDGDTDFEVSGDWTVQERLKFMPGAQVTLAEGTKLNVTALSAMDPTVKNELAFYDSFHDSDPVNTDNTQYPSGRGSSGFTIGGGVRTKIASAFGGAVTIAGSATESAPAIVQLTNDAAAELKTREANGYYNTPEGKSDTMRELTFHAVIVGKDGAETSDVKSQSNVEPGRTYLCWYEDGQLCVSVLEESLITGGEASEPGGFPLVVEVDTEDTVETNTGALSIVGALDPPEGGQGTLEVKLLLRIGTDEQTQRTMEKAVVLVWDAGSGCWAVDPDSAAFVQDGITYTVAYVEECRHLKGLTLVEAKAPTCTRAGVMVHYRCGICGSLFSDAEGERKISAPETVVAATGHSLRLVPAKFPTCTETGMKAYVECKVCGSSFSDAEGLDGIGESGLSIPAKGHVWGAWEYFGEATVFKEGEREHTCLRCGLSETEIVPEEEAVIGLNATDLKMKKGQTTSKLRVTQMGSGDQVVSVKSGDSKVVRVISYSGEGRIWLKAKKLGKAKITVTLESGVQEAVKVTVQKDEVRTTRIEALKKLTIKKGEKASLGAAVVPITSVQEITYKSSNPKVAKVNKNGVVKARKKGTARITIASGGKKTVCAVKVE